MLIQQKILQALTSLQCFNILSHFWCCNGIHPPSNKSNLPASPGCFTTFETSHLTFLKKQVFHTTHTSRSHSTFALTIETHAEQSSHIRDKKEKEKQDSFFVRRHLEAIVRCGNLSDRNRASHPFPAWLAHINTRHKNKHIKSYIKAKGAIKNHTPKKIKWNKKPT